MPDKVQQYLDMLRQILSDGAEIQDEDFLSRMDQLWYSMSEDETVMVETALEMAKITQLGE